MLPIFLLDAFRRARFAEKDICPFLHSHLVGRIKISTRIFEKHDCPKRVTLGRKVEMWVEKEKDPQLTLSIWIRTDWHGEKHVHTVEKKPLLCPFLYSPPKTKIILSLVRKKTKSYTQKRFKNFLQNFIVHCILHFSWTNHQLKTFKFQLCYLLIQMFLSMFFYKFHKSSSKMLCTPERMILLNDLSLSLM